MSNSVNDEGLSSEVANGDGGFIIFGKSAFGFFVEDTFSEESGALNGELRDMELFFV